MRQTYCDSAYSTQPGQQGSVPPCVFPPGCMFGGQPLAALLQALPSLERSASRTSLAAPLQVVSQTMVRAMGLGRLAGLCGCKHLVPPAVLNCFDPWQCFLGSPRASAPNQICSIHGRNGRQFRVEWQHGAPTRAVACGFVQHRMSHADLADCPGPAVERGS